MDMLSKLIELLRGKKTPADPLQADQDPNAMAGGLAAATDPAYAAYVREARSMGEAPVSREEYNRLNSGR